MLKSIFTDQERMKLANDVSLFVLDNSGIVFNETAQEIYELNATATFIWCRLEEGESRPNLERDLADTFGFEYQEAKQYVDEAQSQWQALGFFDHPQPQETVNNAPGEVSPPKTERRLIAGVPVSLRRYEIAQQSCRLTLFAPELESWVYPVLSHLEVPDPGNLANVIDIAVLKDGHRYIVAENGQALFRCKGPHEVTPYTQHLVFNRSLRKAGYDVAFHAAGVSDGERALLLPGSAGSGKTSLTAALLHAGYQYLSDDVVFLRKGKPDLEGLPYSLGIKEGSALSHLSSLFPEIGNCRVHRRGDGQNLRYLAPPYGALPSRSKLGVTAAWIVFPSLDAQADTSLRELNRCDALRRLLRTCTLSRPLSRAQVGNLVSLVRNTETYELPMASLRIAVQSLNDLWGRSKNDHG